MSASNQNYHNDDSPETDGRGVGTLLLLLLFPSLLIWAIARFGILMCSGLEMPFAGIIFIFLAAKILIVGFVIVIIILVALAIRRMMRRDARSKSRKYYQDMLRKNRQKDL